MSDASVRNFCSYACVVTFQAQFMTKQVSPGFGAAAPFSATSPTQLQGQQPGVLAQSIQQQTPSVTKSRRGRKNSHEGFLFFFPSFKSFFFFLHLLKAAFDTSFFHVFPGPVFDSIVRSLMRSYILQHEFLLLMTCLKIFLQFILQSLAQLVPDIFVTLTPQCFSCSLFSGRLYS